MRGFNVFYEDSWLDSFVHHESARLVKFYTLESETNKCVKSASQGYGLLFLKNGKMKFLKHAQLSSRALLEQNSQWEGYDRLGGFVGNPRLKKNDTFHQILKIKRVFQRTRPAEHILPNDFFVLIQP